MFNSVHSNDSFNSSLDLAMFGDVGVIKISSAWNNWNVQPLYFFEDSGRAAADPEG